MSAAAGAAAAAAAVAKALKASGTIVRLAPDEFLKLLEHNAQGLIVHTVGGVFSTRHNYLMGYKGLAFYTSSPEVLPLPGGCQIVEARKMWIPG